MKPVIPWMGGKRRLAKHILPLFPEHTCYAEPFCGAAALFFMKTPSEVEIINDVNGELINLYRVIKHHFEEFARQFKWLLCSRDQFGWMNATPPHTLTDIQRAVRFYYLQKLCFGGKTHHHTFGTATVSPPRLNLLRFEEDLSAAHLRLSRTQIEHLHWHDCMQRYDRTHTLFYCDPPYWKTTGYGVPFEFEQYEKLAAMAGSIQGKMIISINDHPDIRRIFTDFPVQRVTVNYSVRGGTERKSGNELIITSFEPDREKS